MAFPVSLPDDGLIDVMAMPLVSKVTFGFGPAADAPFSLREKTLL
jgi:hypothetical protein